VPKSNRHSNIDSTSFSFTTIPTTTIASTSFTSQKLGEQITKEYTVPNEALNSVNAITKEALNELLGESFKSVQTNQKVPMVEQTALIEKNEF
jgi:hypothetical protein